MKYSIFVESFGQELFAPDGATLLVDYINVEERMVTICIEDVDMQCEALLWCIQNGLKWTRNDDGVYVQFPIDCLKVVELYQEKQ